MIFFASFYFNILFFLKKISFVVCASSESIHIEIPISHEKIEIDDNLSFFFILTVVVCDVISCCCFFDWENRKIIIHVCTYAYFWPGCFCVCTHVYLFLSIDSLHKNIFPLLAIYWLFDIFFILFYFCFSFEYFTRTLAFLYMQCMGYVHIYVCVNFKLYSIEFWWTSDYLNHFIYFVHLLQVRVKNATAGFLLLLKMEDKNLQNLN